MKTNPPPLGAFACVLGASVFLVTPARAQSQLTAQTVMPLRLEAVVSAASSGQEDGTPKELEFQGVITLGGASLDIVLRQASEERGLGPEQEFSTVLLPAGDTIVLQRQIIPADTAGNPYLWVRFFNAEGHAVGNEIPVGRLGESTLNIDTNLGTYADVTARIARDKPGQLAIEGGVAFAEGLQAQFILREHEPSDADEGGDESTVRSGLITLIPAGEHSRQSTRYVATREVNPRIFAQFRHGLGRPIGQEMMIGRSNELARAR